VVHTLPVFTVNGLLGSWCTSKKASPSKKTSLLSGKRFSLNLNTLPELSRTFVPSPRVTLDLTPGGVEYTLKLMGTGCTALGSGSTSVFAKNPNPIIIRTAAILDIHLSSYHLLSLFLYCVVPDKWLMGMTFWLLTGLVSNSVCVSTFCQISWNSVSRRGYRVKNRTKINSLANSTS